jgi:hypothetical protein
MLLEDGLKISDFSAASTTIDLETVLQKADVNNDDLFASDGFKYVFRLFRRH